MDSYKQIACICSGREGYGVARVLKAIAENFPGMLFVFQEDGNLAQWLCDHNMRTRRLNSLISFSARPGQTTLTGMLKIGALYYRMRKAAKDLRAVLESENIKIVHSHWLMHHLITGFLPKSMCSKIWHIHGVMNTNRFQGKIKNIYSAMVDWGATDLVCVSETVGNNYTLRKAKKHIVYNGADIFYNCLPTREFQPPYQLILAGRIEQVKGIHLAVGAVAELLKKGLDVHLNICGGPLEENAYYNLLCERIKTLDIQSHVTFHGYVDNIRQMNAEMHVALHCYLGKEGCGIWVQEAMLDGIPVVSTRCGGPEELIDHEQNGLLLSEHNENNLARAIASILVDKNKWGLLGTNAFQKAQKQFTVEKFSENMRSVYRSIYSPEVKDITS